MFPLRLQMFQGLVQMFDVSMMKTDSERVNRDKAKLIMEKQERPELEWHPAKAVAQSLTELSVSMEATIQKIAGKPVVLPHDIDLEQLREKLIKVISPKLQWTSIMKEVGKQFLLRQIVK